MSSKKQRDQEMQKRLITAVGGAVFAASLFMLIIYLTNTGESQEQADNWEGEEYVSPAYTPGIVVNTTETRVSQINHDVEAIEEIMQRENAVESSLAGFDPHLMNAKPARSRLKKPELLLNQDDWAAMHHMKKKAKEEKKINQKNEGIRKRFYKDGKWYWGTKNRPHAENMCYYNMTTRAADFWAPVQGTWVHNKQALPIYFAYDCWSIKFHAGALTPKYNCDISRSQSCQKLQFKPRECKTMPLHDEDLLRVWAGRSFWFFGDYSSFQQYEAMKCTMFRFKKSEHRYRGETTGTKVTMTAFQNDITLYYVYSGLHSDDTPKTKTQAIERPLAQGLTEEFMREHNLTRSANEWENLEHKVLLGDNAGMYTFADVVREQLHNMKPWDIMVGNIGHDFSEPRVYQRHLLDFLKVYEAAKEDMPVLIWRETTAQHHDNTMYTGGDIASPILRDYIAPPPPTPSPPPLALDKHGRIKSKKARAGAVGPKPVWMKRARDVKCVPIPFEQHKEHNWRNELANRLVEAAGIPILRVWEASTQRYDWYSGRCMGAYCENFGPCMHYCNPGVTTHWNELLRTMLLSPVLTDPLNARLPQPPPPPMTPANPTLPPGGVFSDEINRVREMDLPPPKSAEEVAADALDPPASAGAAEAAEKAAEAAPAIEEALEAAETEELQAAVDALPPMAPGGESLRRRLASLQLPARPRDL